jgi:hypothetical protein
MKHTIEKHKDDAGEFWTTPLFWDCSCNVHYIHDAEKDADCKFCGDTRENAPDSRVDEVVEMASTLNLSKAKVMQLFGSEEGRKLDDYLQISPVDYANYVKVHMPEMVRNGDVYLIDEAIYKLTLFSVYVDARGCGAGHMSAATEAVRLANKVRKVLGYQTSMKVTF